MLSIDPIRLLVEHNLLKLLTELPPGWPPAPMVVEQSLHGLSVSLRFAPPGSELPANDHDGRTNAIEREVLDAVRVEIDRLGRRVMGAEIRTALKAAGCQWGVSTINRTLAELVARKILVNERDGRGYGITDGNDQ